MKDCYMVTVVYLHGKTVDIEFETNEDRTDFIKSIDPFLQSELCTIKITVWELEKMVIA